MSSSQEARGRRVRALLTERTGVSSELGIARQLGISRQAVHRMFIGGTPDPGVVDKIAPKLEMSVEEFYLRWLGYDPGVARIADEIRKLREALVPGDVLRDAGTDPRAAQAGSALIADAPVDLGEEPEGDPPVGPVVSARPSKGRGGTQPQ